MPYFSSKENISSIGESAAKVSYTPQGISLKEAILKNSLAVSIAIDGSKHSSQVELFDASRIENSMMLPAGIDGVIVTNITQSKKGVQLFLLTADCAPIAISSRDGNIIALLHGGWQGIAGGIIQTFDSLIKNQDVQKQEIFVHIGPMVGANYEFDTQDILSHFSPNLQYLGMSIEKYYTLSQTEEKAYLDLRKLIHDVFIFLGYKSQNIFFYPLQTNDFNNTLPSHRLHSKAKKIMAKLGIETIPISEKRKDIPSFDMLSSDEKVFFLSEIFELYIKSSRILTKVSSNL